MKILHIITSLRIGGAERLMVDLLPRLNAQHQQVDLLLFDGTRTAFYEELESRGITIHSLGTGMYSMYNPLHVWKLIKCLPHYDVVHTHNTPCQLLTAVAHLFAKQTILLTTEHNTSNRRRHWSWYRPIDKWMYRQYAKVICVSKDTRDNLLQAVHDNSLVHKTYTICNGIDLTKFANATPNTMLREQLKGKHIILMVAAFRPQKDHDTLLRAMRLLPDEYALVLAGDGTCRHSCENAVRELGIAHKVHFLGNRKDIPSLMATADTIVLSSHYEGQSVACLEAMASGKPFIASDVDGLHNIVDGGGLLFAHGNFHELACLIQKVYQDKKFAAHIGSRGKERAKDYDISAMAERYRNLYLSDMHINHTL